MITRADSNTLITFSEAAAVSMGGSRPGTTTSSAILLSPTGSRGHSSAHGGAHSGKHFMNASTVSSLSGRMGFDGGFLSQREAGGMDGSRRAGSASGRTGSGRHHHRSHSHHHRQSSITSNSHNPINLAGMSVASVVGSLSMQNQWFDIEEALGIAITAAVRGAGVLVEAEEIGRVESAAIGFAKACASAKGSIIDRTPTPVTASATALSNASIHSRRSGMEPNPGPSPRRSKANSIPSTKSPTLSSGAVHHSGSSFSPPSTTQIGGGGMGEMADHHLHPHHRLNSPMRRSSGGTPGMGSASSGLSGTGGLMAPSSRSSSPPLAKSQRAGSGAETSLSAATAVARARETVVRYLQAYTDRVVQASLAAVPPAGGTGLPGSTAADSAGVHPRPGTPPPAFAATTTMSSMGSPLPIISNSPSAGGLAHLNVSHTAAALPSLGSPRGGGGGGHGSGRPARLSSPGVAGGHLSPGASSSSIPQLCGAFPRSSSPQTPTMVAVTNTATGVPTASTHLPSMTSFSSHGQLRSPPLATGGSGVGGGPDEDGTGGSADGGEPPQQQLCHSGGAGRLSIKDSLSPAGTPPLLSSLQLSGSSTSSASRVPLVMSGATTTASPPPKSKLLQGHPNHNNNNNNNNNNNGGGNSSSCGPHSSIGSTAPTAPPQVSGSSGMSWNAGHLSPKSNRASRTPSPMLRGSMNNDSSLLGARRCSGSVAPPNVLSTPRPPSPMSNSSVGGGVGGLLTMVPQTAPSHPARTAGATQLHISTATPPLGFSTTTTLGSTTALNAIPSPAVPTLRMKVLRPDEAPPFPTPLHSGGEMDAAAETASSSSSSYSYSCSTSSSSTTSHSQGDPDGGVARPPGAGAGHRCRHHRRRRLSTSSSSNSKSSSSTFCNTSNPSNGSSRSFSGDGASCSSSSSSPSSSTSCSCSSAMVSSLSSDDSNSIPALYASASRPTLVQQGSGSRHAATHPAPHYSQRSTLHPTTLDLVEDLSDPHASSHHVHPPNYNPNKAGHRHPPPPLDSNTHHHHKAARGGERDDGWMRSGSEGPSYPSEELGARLQSETQGNEKKFASVNTATAAQGSSSPLPPLPVASTTTPTTSPMMGPMSASASSTPFLPLRGFTSPVSPFSGTLGSRRFGAPLQLPTTSPQYAWIVDLNEVSAARGLPDTYISVTLVRDSDPELSVLFFPFAKEKFTWNPHATHPPAQPGGATHSHHSNTNNNAPNNSVPPPPPAPLVFGGGGLHGLSGVPQRSGSIASVNAMTFASASGFSGLQEGRNRGAGGMSSKAVSEASALLLSPSAIGMSAATGGGGGGASSIIGGGGGGGNLRAGRVGSAGATSMGGSSIFAFGNPTTMTDHHDVCIGSPPPTPRSGVQTPPPPPFSMPHSTFNSPGNSPQSTAGGNPHHHNHSNNNNNNSSSNSNTNTGVLLTQGTGTGAFNSNSPFFLPPSAATGTGTGFDRSPSLQFPPLSPSSPAPSVHGMRDGGLLPSTPSASYYHTGERGPSPPGGGPAGVAHFTPWWTGGELFISVEDRGAFLNGVRLNSGTASGGGSAYASLHHRPFTSASGRTSPNQLYSMLPTPPPTFLNASPQSHPPPPVNHTNGGPTFQASVPHEHSLHSYHPIAPHSAIADRLRQTSLGTIMTELGSASASSTSSPNRPMIDPLPNPPPMRPHSRQSRPGLRSASSSTATLDFSTAVAAAASASPLSRAVVLLHSKPPPPVTAPRSASAPPFFSSGTSVSANTTHNRAGAGVGTRVSVVPPTAEAQSSVTAVPIEATLDEQRQHEAEQERLTDIAAELVVHHDVDSLQYGSHPVAAMAAIAAGRADVLLNTGVYYVGWHHLLGAALLVREAGGYVKGITGTTNATRDHTGGAAAGCRRGPDSQQRKSSAAASSNTPQKEEVFPVHGKTGSACTNTTTTTAAVTTASETVPAKDRTGGDASFAAATATAVETEEPRRKSRGRPRRQRSAPSQRGSTPPPPHPPEEPDLRRGKRPARRSNESSLVTGGAGSGSGGGDTMGAVPAQASLPPSRPDEDPQTPGPGELRQRKLAAAAGATGSGVYAMDPHNEPSGPLPCHERTGTLSPLSSEDDLDEERQKKRLQQKTKTFNASSVPDGLAVQSHPIDSSSTPSRDGSPLLLAEVMTVEESFSPPPPSKKPASRKSQKKKHHHTKKKHHHHHHHHHTCSHIVPDQQQQEQQQRVEEKDGDAQDPTRKAEGKQKQKHKHHHCRRRLRGGHPHNNGDQKREEDDDEKRASSTSPLMLMVGGETAPLQASNSFGEDLIQLHVPASRSPHRNSGSSSSKKPPPLLDPTSEHHGHPSASYAGAPPQRHQRHRRCGRHHGHRRRQGSPAHANTTTTANHPRQNGSSGGGGGGVQSSGKKPFLLHTSHGASCSSVLLSPSSTGGGRAGGRPSSSLQSHHRRGARRGGGGHRRRRVASQSFSDSFMMDEDHNPDYRPPNSPSEIVGIIAALDQQVVETMSRICMEKKLGVRVEMTDEDGKG